MSATHAGAILRHLHRFAQIQAVREASDGQLLRRFADQRDHDAFAGLMRRHGGMVWSVCRHILTNEHDAEDAFQATFLVLAQRVGSIRQSDSVAGWLHGVAYRLAVRAKQMSAKRQARERQAAVAESTSSQQDASLRELQALLDEEVHRLPERYRVPFVLCCLEGKCWKDAAAELGWKEGTLSTRIAQARKLLQSRLIRRGVTLSAALTAAVVGDSFASASMPAGLLKSTLKAAALVGAGRSAAQVIAPSVAALVKGGMKTMATTKLYLAAVLVLAASTLGGISWAVGWVESSRPPISAPCEGGDTGGVGLEDSTHPTKNRETTVDLAGEPLPAGALARLGSTRFRHGDSVEWLQFTPDGKVLISRGNGGARTWDTATGRRIHLFPKESEGGLPTGASLLPNGKLLATPGEKSLRIWDLATAKLLRTIDIQTGRAIQGKCLFTCFSADGKLLASQNGDHLNQISVWNAATGQHVRTWTAGERWITFLAFADHDKTLITSGDANSICAWDVATGEKIREIVKLSDGIHTLALSPDGKVLATVGYTTKAAGPGTFSAIPHRYIQVWEVATGKQVRRIEEPGQEGKDKDAAGFQNLTFVPGGQSLLAGAADGTLYLCDLTGAKSPRRVWKSTSMLEAVAPSPDGKTAAVATGSTIHLIDLVSGKEILPITGHPEHVYKTAITPDGRTVLTTSGSDLFLWDTATGRLRKRLQGHKDYINGLVLIDGGHKAVTSAYQEGTLRVWDLTAAKEAYRIESTDKSNIVQAVSPDGKTIAVGGSNSVTVLYDALTGKEIRRLEGHGKFNDYGAAFTPDGKMLVVWYCEDNMVYLWDLATGKKVREYAFIDGDPPQPNPPAGFGRPVYFAAVSPDGRLIAFGSQSKFFEVRDLMTGDVLYRETKLPDGVCPITFSPDSRTLAWSGWWGDPTVHVVEIATGKDRLRFAGHTGRVLSLSFSADGTKLVSGSGDTTALVWDLMGKRNAKENGARPLSGEEIESAWTDLAGEDASRGYDAIRRFSASPAEAVEFLARNLKPIPKPDEKRLASLIADLDSDAFAVRENATKELEALGETAVDACQKALQANPAAEVRRRLQTVLHKQASETARPSPERLRTLRAIEVLERAGTAEARHVLASLADGAPAAWLTREAKAALERLKATRRAN